MNRRDRRLIRSSSSGWGDGDHVDGKGKIDDQKTRTFVTILVLTRIDNAVAKCFIPLRGFPE